jgi:hypothetical protein
MSRGPSGQRRLILSEMPVMPAPVVQAQQGADGQVDLRQADQPVLKYIYQTNEPGNLLEKIRPGNRIYARARSDYIHPLYGLDGVELTKDWSADHPHHRGIYWAWPEVDYHGQRGDLHALQRVFARPTGHLRLTEGPVLALVDAENLWYWEDRDAIVRERVVIRVFRAESPGRLVDLEFYFTALKEGVTVARRGMAHYGGLNLRLSKVTNQVITFFTDPPGVEPRRAWSDLSGTFAGGKAPAGLAVFPHPANPAHPPEWIQYPDLNWAQPTFPAAGQRYPLSLTEPLVLRFRLWIHQGTKATDAAFGKQWKNYQELKSPRL